MFHTSSAGIGELERMVIFPATRSGRMKLRWVNWLTNWITSVRSRLSKDITTVRAWLWISFLSTGALGGGWVARVAPGCAGAGWPVGGGRGGAIGTGRRGGGGVVCCGGVVVSCCCGGSCCCAREGDAATRVPACGSEKAPRRGGT